MTSHDPRLFVHDGSCAVLAGRLANRERVEAGRATTIRDQSSPAHDVLRGYGPDAEANGVHLTISEANATVVADLLAVMPADVLEIEVNDIRAVAV
jgi:predicted naringenin-chalcone synthase